MANIPAKFPKGRSTEKIKAPAESALQLQGESNKLEVFVRTLPILLGETGARRSGITSIEFSSELPENLIFLYCKQSLETEPGEAIGLTALAHLFSLFKSLVGEQWSFPKFCLLILKLQNGGLLHIIGAGGQVPGRGREEKKQVSKRYLYLFGVGSHRFYVGALVLFYMAQIPGTGGLEMLLNQ